MASLYHTLAHPAHPAPPLQGIFKKMAASSSKPPPRMSIESGPFTFHYLVDAGDVCYLTLTEKAYPKKLAFQYLEELASEFSRLYADQIEGVTRPYAFIKFGALAWGWEREGGPSLALLLYWGHVEHQMPLHVACTSALLLNRGA